MAKKHEAPAPEPITPPKVAARGFENLVRPDSSGRMGVTGTLISAYEKAWTGRGATEAQTKALVLLHPYTVLDIHCDGDLTVKSGDAVYIVTLSGKVFKQLKYDEYRKARKLEEQPKAPSGSLFAQYAKMAEEARSGR